MRGALQCDADCVGTATGALHGSLDGLVPRQCHAHAAEYFGTSVHASEDDHKGCVQCHGGGEGRHDHLIERITQPAGLMIERYAHLVQTERDATPEQIAVAIHPDPKQIMDRALPTCTACHDEIDEDESLPKLYSLLDDCSRDLQ